MCLRFSEDPSFLTLHRRHFRNDALFSCHMMTSLPQSRTCFCELFCSAVDLQSFSADRSFPVRVRTVAAPPTSTHFPQNVISRTRNSCTSRSKWCHQFGSSWTSESLSSSDRACIYPWRENIQPFFFSGLPSWSSPIMTTLTVDIDVINDDMSFELMQLFLLFFGHGMMK